MVNYQQSCKPLSSQKYLEKLGNALSWRSVKEHKFSPWWVEITPGGMVTEETLFTVIKITVNNFQSDNSLIGVSE